MFSVSKKSILLPIIFFSALQTQCSQPLYDIGTPKRTITINIDDIPQKENSQLYELGKILLPVAGGALINYIIQKYNEDPETTALNKEEKKVNLAIKQHPDYVGIETQRKKNEVAEAKLNLKQKKLELSATQASIIQHHQERWNEFKKCNSPYTHDFCSDMIKIHEKELSKYIKNTQNNS